MQISVAVVLVGVAVVMVGLQQAAMQASEPAPVAAQGNARLGDAAATHPPDFFINYTVQAGFGVSSAETIISADGNYRYTLSFPEGVVGSRTGHLSPTEMQALYRALLDSGFFAVPEDLTVTPCPASDLGSGFLSVRTNGRVHRAGGMCVMDYAFLSAAEAISQAGKRFFIA